MVKSGRFPGMTWEGTGSPGGEASTGSLVSFHRRAYSGTQLKGLSVPYPQHDYFYKDQRKMKSLPRWYMWSRKWIGVVVLVLVLVGTMLLGSHFSYKTDTITKRIEMGLDKLKVLPIYREEDVETPWQDDVSVWNMLPSLQIPKTVHFMYHGSDELKEREILYKDLQNANPGWEIRTYNIELAEMHVKSWFPAFLETFVALRNDEEKEIVFRYLSVLKFGGVACCGMGDSRPESLNLTNLLTSKDTFVAVWNSAYSSASAALNSCRVRQRSIRHDFIAAVKKHPVLMDVYNQISSMKDKVYSQVESLNTLERTGEGILTDTVLSYALHGSFQQEIRILPSKTFPKSSDQTCIAPWRSSGGAQEKAENVAYPAQLEISEWFSKNDHEEKIVAEIVALLEKVAQREAQYTLVPVSTRFDPPFDVMTHAAGVGEWHAGSDVSAALLAYGTWQPSVLPNRGPNLVDIIVGSLKRIPGVFVEVGAGYGLTSLAAASRGHKVIAFEVGSKSLEAFQDSISRNGFQDLIKVHKYPLGSASQEGESVCLRVSESNMTIDSDLGRMQHRGYGLPFSPDEEKDGCLIGTVRHAGHLVSGSDRISALKISADGWGGHVIDGFLPLLKPARDRPKLISIEWNPELYRKSGYSQPLKILEQLYSLGYKEISHSGYICDERWQTLTYDMNKRRDLDDSKSLRQPTWCRLEQNEFQVLLKLGELSKTIETILFIDKDGRHN